jgi:hypothetical protein
MMRDDKALAVPQRSAIVKSGSTSLLTTPNGFTVKQDASGNMGIYNASAVEVAFFDGNGKLNFLSVNTTFPATNPAIGNDNSNDLKLTANAGVIILGNMAWFAGKIGMFNSISTAGLGVPAIYAVYSTTGNNIAVTNAINYTPPATAGTYRLTFTVDTRVATTDNFYVVATWKDAAGTARSQTIGGSNAVGSALVAGAITNTIGTGTYYGSVLFQIDNSATAITLSTVGTFTTVTYDLAATLEQLA